MYELFGHRDKGRQIPIGIESDIALNGVFRFSERCPREERKA